MRSRCRIGMLSRLVQVVTSHHLNRSPNGEQKGVVKWIDDTAERYFVGRAVKPIALKPVAAEGGFCVSAEDRLTALWTVCCARYRDPIRGLKNLRKGLSYASQQPLRVRPERHITQVVADLECPFVTQRTPPMSFRPSPLPP
jgi:hypothetical protein